MPDYFSCNQRGCPCPADYRFTWPGRDEAFICKGHVEQLRSVARAMGLHLQVIQINPADRAATEDGHG